MFSIAILAGGLATRLYPISKMRPKSLIDIAGKPFIFRQLDYLKKQGMEHVVICIGHLGETIRAEVGPGKKFGLKIDYSEDGPVRLGTGGAIKKATTLLDDNFFILYGDSFLPINFSQIENAYRSVNKKGLMTIFKNDNQLDSSNVLYLDGKLIEYNKRAPSAAMAHIDYGLTILSKNTLSIYGDNQVFDISDLYHQLSVRDELHGHLISDRFYEIGSIAGIKETIKFFSDGLATDQY